jgi:hypothetical protein|tara:strand:+ start:39 stop:410 length:372 start_codon:yes stop_codon:yes gene_type:complete
MIKLKKLINERKFGEPLPKLERSDWPNMSKQTQISEKKELGGAKIHMIDMATDRNHHNEARRLLAVYMGNKKLAKVYTAIEDLNMALGHLPPELSKLRMKMDKELFKQSYSKYSDHNIIVGVF